MDMVYYTDQTSEPLPSGEYSRPEIVVQISICAIHDDYKIDLLSILVFKVCVNDTNNIMMTSVVEDFRFLYKFAFFDVLRC